MCTRMSSEIHIREGVQYRHYQGGMYTILAVAMDATNANEGRRVVVYRAQVDGAVYVRTVDEFLEPVLWPDGTTRSRFAPAESV